MAKILPSTLAKAISRPSTATSRTVPGVNSPVLMVRTKAMLGSSRIRLLCVRQEPLASLAGQVKASATLLRVCDLRDHHAFLEFFDHFRLEANVGGTLRQGHVVDLVLKLEQGV